MLHAPTDTATRKQVSSILDKLAADPANGIDHIVTGVEAEQSGAFPGAAFLVLLKAGF